MLHVVLFKQLLFLSACPPGLFISSSPMPTPLVLLRKQSLLRRQVLLLVSPSI